ncbi:MAG: hypothetical protein K2X01_05090 [Cyanobacteria bacterium]|nr:hypothetical protein [Cyanobacteriota bacterium]
MFPLSSMSSLFWSRRKPLRAPSASSAAVSPVGGSGKSAEYPPGRDASGHKDTRDMTGNTPRKASPSLPPQKPVLATAKPTDTILLSDATNTAAQTDAAVLSEIETLKMLAKAGVAEVHSSQWIHGNATTERATRQWEVTTYPQLESLAERLILRVTWEHPRQNASKTSHKPQLLHASIQRLQRSGSAGSMIILHHQHMHPVAKTYMGPIKPGTPCNKVTRSLEGHHAWSQTPAIVSAADELVNQLLKALGDAGVV